MDNFHGDQVVYSLVYIYWFIHLSFNNSHQWILDSMIESSIVYWGHGSETSDDIKVVAKYTFARDHSPLGDNLCSSKGVLLLHYY